MRPVAADLEAVLAPEFELVRRLGEGSTATVYLARETQLRRLVAIKVPAPLLAHDPLVRSRFEREARAAARLRHPSITAIHRIARMPDGAPYLVMEYLDGHTLADLLQAEGALPQGVAVRVLGQVASALAEAHAHGVIHRDVRPGNVFWMPDSERAVLSDFGIAGILESGAEVVTRLTRPGELLGDPVYRSPEQLLGEPLTPAADVYGWALVAFEVLTLQRPYVAESPESVANAHLRQAPRVLGELLPDVDPRLADLVQRCLAKEPRHRPSAPALVRSLAKLRPHRSRSQAFGSAQNMMATAAGRLPIIAAFLGELRRRRVYNVALGYAAAGFILLQASGLILPALPLPPWTYPLVVAGVLAGFPVALVVAWMYDLTEAGLRRTEALAHVGPVYLRWLLPTLGLLLSLLLAALIGWWVLSA